MAEFVFAKSEEGFDNHIRNSIRGFDDLCSDIVEISQYFINYNSHNKIVDIGCSTGRLLSEIKKYTPEEIDIIISGVDIDPQFREQFLHNVQSGSFILEDICDYNYKNMKYLQNSSLIISIFTLQFTPFENRKEILKTFYDNIVDGGALIISEKTLATNSRFQEICTFNHYKFKSNNFSYEQIFNKQQTLRSMMKLKTIDEHISDLKEAGFKTVDTFWQNHAFVGFVAIK